MSELPPWARHLRDRYLSGEGCLFLVHGNVRDLQPYTEDDGSVHWVDMRGFLERFLGRTRQIVASYNVSQGLGFAAPGEEARARRLIDAWRARAGQPPLGLLPRLPGEALSCIEALITDPTCDSGVILDFFETLAPAADLSFMTSDDKSNLVTMRRWSSDPALLGTNNLVVMLTEHLSDIHRSLVASPQLVTVHVPFPEPDTRMAFLRSELSDDVPLAMPIEALAKVTAGLTLIQIRGLLQMGRQRGESITFEAVSRRKKVVIEQECHGLVEFVDPRHGLDDVGGMAGVKGELRRVADAVKGGRRNQVPMGMIFVGPMGTGKTFVAEAFARDSGLTCLRFKNFRDRWVGSTEANLEKVLELVDALGFVLLMIDEADRALSSGESDGGTTSRVIARLKEFMSNTGHRGRVVMLMMTNRPDKLDTDLKRPGRFDLKIPFFFAEEAAERRQILAAVQRRNEVRLEDGVTLDAAAAATEGYSSAELEAVLLAANTLAARDGREEVTADDLATACRDVIPSRDERMLTYMEMLAVFECSSRTMLPERYQQMDTSEVLRQLDALRVQLGRRV